MRLALPALLLASAASAQSPRELRGAWIANDDGEVFSSREKIVAAMDFLGRHHFNVVYPVVWSHGYTLYASQVAARAFGSAIDPRYAGRDPLAELVLEAHRNGLEVVPWFEYGFAAGEPEHARRLFERHPDWAARDRAGRILEKDGLQWLDAFDPEVQAFFTDLVLEVAKGYDVDGVQGDDRLPALPSTGGYDARTTQLFAERAHRLAPADPYDPEWLAFRAGLLTQFLADVRDRVRAVDSHLVVSLAPAPCAWGRREYLQDPKVWVQRKLADSLHPQLFQRGVEPYERALDLEIEALGPLDGCALAPGILVSSGRSRPTKEGLLACVAYDRRKKLAGEVFYGLDGLRENGGELGKALSTGPYAALAVLPYRESGPWRPRAVEIPFDVEFATGEWSPIAGATGAWQVTTPGRAAMKYEADIDVGASYEVYLDVPDVTNMPARVSWSLRAGENATEAALFTPRHGAFPLARLRLAAGSHVSVRVEAEREQDKRLALGRLSFVVDRRKSPQSVFKP